MSTEPSRNAPCNCGSGKRYKHCHGSTAYEEAITRAAQLGQLQAQLHAQREKERQRHQGLGRPIITTLMENGTRVVAVHSRVFVGSWKTFPDFLMHYITAQFTTEWGNSELTKPASERHPLLNLYQSVCAVQQQSAAGQPTGAIFVSPMTGAVSLYLGLAYDLYCVEHNAKTQPVWERLMHRLRTTVSFSQAAYELLAAGAFARAGFALDFEDDTDSSRKHVEFIATHPGTGARFAVECKRRGTIRESDKPRVVSHLNKALRQNQTGLPLIVFIELDRAVQYRREDGVPSHLLEAIEQLEGWANDERSAACGPAYVMLTNQPQAHFPDEPLVGFIGYMHGFKIPELAYRETGPLEDLVRAQELHPEMHDLHRSIRKHTHFPTSFDGNEDRRPELEIETPLDAYNFMHSTYRDSPREALLNMMEKWPNQDELRATSQADLAKRYSIHCALGLLQEIAKNRHRR